MEQKLLPPEIISMILLNLEDRDLKKYRLVSKEWDKLCLKAMKKLNLKYYLDKKRYKKLILRSAHFTPKELWFKFHVDISGNYPRKIEKLVELFGRKCISHITIHDLEPEDLEKLIQMFRLVSAGLESLDTSEIYYFGSGSLAAVEWDFIFPEMLKLKIDAADKYTMSLTCKILKSSPNLKSLIVDGDNGTHANCVNLDSLTSLSYKGALNFDYAVQVQQSKKLPESMKLLRVNEWTREVLTSFAPFLTSLFLCAVSEKNTPSWNFEFPPMPKLKELSLFRNETETIPYVLKTGTRNFNSYNFPAVEVVDVPLGFFFLRGHGTDSFTSVRTLCVRVGLCDFQEIAKRKNSKEWPCLLIGTYSSAKKITITTNVEHWLQMFPNLSVVRLINEYCEPYTRDPNLKNLIRALLYHCNTGNFEKLEFDGICEDYLGQVILNAAEPKRFLCTGSRFDDKNEAYKCWSDYGKYTEIREEKNSKNSTLVPILTADTPIKMKNLRILRYGTGRDSAAPKKKFWNKESVRQLECVLRCFTALEILQIPFPHRPSYVDMMRVVANEFPLCSIQYV